MPGDRNVSIAEPGVFSLVATVLPRVGMSPVRTVPGVTAATYVPTLGARLLTTFVPLIPIDGEVDTTASDVDASVVYTVYVAAAPSRI